MAGLLIKGTIFDPNIFIIKTNSIMATAKKAAPKGGSKKSAAKQGATKSESSKSPLKVDLPRGHLTNSTPAAHAVGAPNAEGNPSSADPQMYGGNQANEKQHERSGEYTRKVKK